MKTRLIISILFLIIYQSSALSNIVYLDVQFIIDNSELGKYYKKKIKNIKKDSLSNLKLNEEKIKALENNINNQKNFDKKEEISKKVEELNILLKEFQEKRNKLKQTIIKDKKEYSIEILKILNPLVTNYVEKNNIELVLDKKNILVGVKSLDITQNLLRELNKKTIDEKLINEK